MGLLPACDIPQGFTRLGSVFAALPAMSESSLVILNAVAATAGDASSARPTAKPMCFLIGGSIDGCVAAVGFGTIAPRSALINRRTLQNRYSTANGILSVNARQMLAARPRACGRAASGCRQYGGVRPV